ncbi:MAG: DUF814 domain-containing protein [Thermodesulfovibrionia bacterium]|nr:DUF814 domain-containing protein [Thermodesulfovibrionia bacterium]
MKFKIDTRKSIPENANVYYEGSKKAKRKVIGAKRALLETRKKLEKLKIKHEVEMSAYVEPEKKKTRKKKWYENFRWFYSSDGFMVVGGKDATTNDILIKKHTDPDDLVFHAHFQGAPFFVIKNPDKLEIPEGSRKETAQAAASYSKAWRLGVGSCDIYCITPEQVSKSAPSGEYVGKGAFMIHGKREWFRGTELRAAIGVVINGTDEEVEVTCGPVDSVARISRYFVTIGVGDKKSAGLAKEIKERIVKKANKEDIEKIKKINISEIQQRIPGGKGKILD